MDLRSFFVMTTSAYSLRMGLGLKAMAKPAFSKTQASFAPSPNYTPLGPYLPFQPKWKILWKRVQSYSLNF